MLFGLIFLFGISGADAANYVVSTLEFPSGQRNLSEDSRQELDKIIHLAEYNATVEEVTVAVWSDKEFPDKGEKLEKSDVNLADARGENIEDYLEDDLNINGVSVFNMAKQPSSMSRIFKTADAKTKQDLIDAGLAVRGRASTAIILVEAR